MAFYLVGGKLGSGKTLVCVGIIRNALRAGRCVATNLDLNLEKMLPRESRATAIRLPDKPGVADFLAIGRGQSGLDEADNGVIVLDECAAWLNARSWGDRERQPVLDWMLHSRKLGWDVYLIAQHLDQIDKQLRTSMVEFSVRCVRLDRMVIPLITPLIKFLTLGLFRLHPPKIHMGVVRYGTERDSLVVDRWMFRGRDLYDAYDTRQVFRDAYVIQTRAGAVSLPHVGLHSMLSPWHLFGRYYPRRTLHDVLRDLWTPSRRRRSSSRPASKLRPLLRLPPDLRWVAARRLVQRGLL